MTQEIRQKIVTLAQELPDELLPEALASLNSIAQKARDLDSKYIDLLHRKLPEQLQKTGSDNSSTCDQPEFDKVIVAYQVISEKYKNALRELAK
ncbi:conserved hypothetical protein [Planktothrix sp. PCC 11201]|uniref:hypothetical protein n=1 Tax=Planktothrix sp. PCC 11201 TaxID=1729650 RepID=UPI0009113755|nr:hypothetical protein [Planktothrix sp. PCC 11201]SKB15738.1 conserved hypothetical protein [Planktothrix sp. PCC 11201]